MLNKSNSTILGVHFGYFFGIFVVGMVMGILGLWTILAAIHSPQKVVPEERYTEAVDDCKYVMVQTALSAAPYPKQFGYYIEYTAPDAQNGVQEKWFKHNPESSENSLEDIWEQALNKTTTSTFALEHVRFPSSFSNLVELSRYNSKTSRSLLLLNVEDAMKHAWNAGGRPSVATYDSTQLLSVVKDGKELVVFWRSGDTERTFFFPMFKLTPRKEKLDEFTTRTTTDVVLMETSKLVEQSVALSLSPDGRFLAAITHARWDKPPQPDTLYLIDLLNDTVLKQVVAEKGQYFAMFGELGTLSSASPVWKGITGIEYPVYASSRSSGDGDAPAPEWSMLSL